MTSRLRELTLPGEWSARVRCRGALRPIVLERTGRIRFEAPHTPEEQALDVIERSAPTAFAVHSGFSTTAEVFLMAWEALPFAVSSMYLPVRWKAIIIPDIPP